MALGTTATLAGAIEHADAAVALLDPDDHPGPYSWSLLLGAYLRLLNGEAATTKRPTAAASSCKSGRSTGTTRSVLGMWPLIARPLRRSARLLRARARATQAAGDVTSVQGTLVRLAEIACWTGDWADADRLADECMALADRTASSAFSGSSLLHAGSSTLPRRLDEARAAAAEIVATSGPTTLGHWLLGFAALSIGDAGTADREYTRAQAIVDAQGQREPAAPLPARSP